MANVEEAQMFETKESEAAAEARAKANAEKKEAYKKFLVECRCFKDFMMGKEKEFAQCKEYIQKYMFNLCQLGGAINVDFIAGVRMAVEMFEELPGKWDKTFAELGQEG